MKNFKGVFLIVHIYLYLQILNWWVLFIHETLLVYNLDTFKNCKERKHIIIMIIAIIYIFYLMWYLINNWKLLSGNLQSLLNKSTPPFLLTSPLKSRKVQVSPFLPASKVFQPPFHPSCRKGRTLWIHFQRKGNSKT